MAQYYDTDALLDSIKRRINIPENQITFSSDDLLAFANEEMSLSLVPSILSLHEDYLLFYEEQDLETGKSNYTIPYRAIGNKLYDLQYVDNNGSVFEMSRTSVGDEPNYKGSNTINQQYAYSVRNNQIHLLPAVSNFSVGKLRFWYYIKPANIVSLDRIGVITAINTTTGEISLSTTPSNFDANIIYDFYKVQSPHTILKINLDAVSVNPTTNTIQFDPDDIPSELEIGDHVAQATESGIPQIPSDLHVYLAQKVAERVLEAQGDPEGLQQARAKSAEMENRAGSIIDNRVTESPIKIVNRHGALRSGLRSRFYRRR